jgi:hypothetical protein
MGSGPVSYLPPLFLAVTLALPVHSAATYCNDATGLVKVRKDRMAWLARLQGREYAELDTFYGALQREYEAGKKSDSEVEAWFGAFDDAKAGLTPLLEAWVKQYPRSYAARRALAGHLYHVAWARRGYNFAEETSAEKQESMRQVLDRMMDVLNAADALTARPTPSYPYRIPAARILAGPLAAREGYQRAEKLDPLNARSKAAYILAVSPKWKGRREQMDEVMANSAAWPEDLARQVGYEMFIALAEGYEMGEKNEEAIRMYESAARNCTAYVAPLVALVRIHKKANDQEGVGAAAQRYVALVPEQSWGYVQLAAAQSRLRRYADSFRNYSKAAEMGDRAGLEGVAWSYAGGHGVKQDMARALDLYLKVNDQGGTHVRPKIEGLRKELGR